MNKLVCLGALISCALLSGCFGGGSGSHNTNNGPAPVGSGTMARDVIRAGDKLIIRLTGVPDPGYGLEVSVPPSGDIKLNLLTEPFHVVGKTPDELAAEIVQTYKSQKIYQNPVVTVFPEERYIIVGGDVRSPSNIPWRTDSTLMSTIYSAGGFTEFANRRSVRVIRGKDKLVFDCVRAIQNPGEDPAVYPGDQIYVSRNPF